MYFHNYTINWSQYFIFFTNIKISKHKFDIVKGQLLLLPQCWSGLYSRFATIW